jgi:hypothetical protein
MLLQRRINLAKKNEVKMDGFPPLTEEDLYFVRKLISHIVPDSTEVINQSGWSEACKQGIEKIDSLNRNYFSAAFKQRSFHQEPFYPMLDDDTEF